MSAGFNKSFDWDLYLSTHKAAAAPENFFTRQQLAKVIKFSVFHHV